MASPKQPTGSPVIKLEIYEVEKVRGLSKFYVSNYKIEYVLLLARY